MLILGDLTYDEVMVKLDYYMYIYDYDMLMKNILNWVDYPTKKKHFDQSTKKG